MSISANVSEVLGTHSGLRGAISLLRSARQSGLTEPLAVVCARIIPTEGPQGS